MARDVKLRILGDEKDLLRAFKRSSQGARAFQSDIGKASRGALAGSGAFQTLGRSIAFASGAFLGAAGFTAAIRGAFGELSQSRQVTAQTNAVLKSTGQVAGVSAEHVEKLGNALLRKTGIDDEAIRSSENLLLTFTNIRNVAGDNNDIFDQATRSALDLSTAFSVDLPSATKMLGKALNDPLKGLTALSRAGVQFSAAQTAQIKAFVKSGNILAAQKIILGELRTQTLGAAEAAGRVQPWNLLRETIRNVGAELVKGLLPNIIKATDRLQKWFDNAENIERLKGGFRTFGDTISNIAGKVQAIVDAFGGWKDALTIATGAFIGFKLVAIASAVQIGAANVIAAGITASAWKAALISTGFGALAVAAGIAATYIITHWSKVKDFFQKLVIQLKFIGNNMALNLIEPFTHLPKFLGGWAKDAKNALIENMRGLREEYAAIGKESGDAFVEAYNKALKKLDAGPKKLPPGPGMTPPGARGLRLNQGVGAKAPGGAGAAGAAGGVTAAQRNTWFDNMIGREEDRVQDIANLNGQLAALKTIEGQLRARLKITKDITRRQKLEDEILKNARDQKGVREQIASDLAVGQEKIAADIAAGLQLNLDRAGLTKGLGDDLKALNAIAANLNKQIAAGKDVLENESALVAVIGQIAGVKEEQAKAVVKARDAGQFKKLGLDETGAALIPNKESLLKTLKGLTSTISGTLADTAKNKKFLAAARKMLSDPFTKVSKEVRSTVAAMLDDIAGQLDGFKGPLTKTTGLDTKKLVAGLGLDPDVIRELRGRVSGVNSAGRMLAGAPLAAGGGFVGGQPIILENHNTITLDGHTVGKSVTRSQQKTRRRNPAQRRGPNRGGF